MSGPIDPLNEIETIDHGSDTASRYRYQWIWAAITCCKLLDPTQQVSELICEHHEDLLIKHTDGTYTGQQIKTREEHLPQWKADDDVFRKACKHFTTLERVYPNSFRNFQFLTNHSLYTAKSSNSIPHILSCLSGAHDITSLQSPIRKWLKAVASQADATELMAFTAMRKTQASNALPKIRDAEKCLVATISLLWPPAADWTYATVQRAAHSLIEECAKASTLDRGESLPSFIISGSDDTTLTNHTFQQKRMTCTRVEEHLEKGRATNFRLEGSTALQDHPGLGQPHLLQQKLDAAGFSIVSRDSAEDLRDKAETLGITWLQQHGNEEGLKRYNHLRSIVLADAGRAFDAVKSDEDGFGPAMREKLRTLFLQRLERNTQLYGATEDHLEGIAFSLTSQCKLTWSHCRPWESP